MFQTEALIFPTAPSPTAFSVSAHSNSILSFLSSLSHTTHPNHQSILISQYILQYSNISGIWPPLTIARLSRDHIISHLLMAVGFQQVSLFNPHSPSIVSSELSSQSDSFRDSHSTEKMTSRALLISLSSSVTLPFIHCAEVPLVSLLFFKHNRYLRSLECFLRGLHSHSTYCVPDAVQRRAMC